jgi:ribonuclease P protein component
VNKILKLKKRSEFLVVRDKGIRSAAPGLVLQVLERKDGNSLRVGFTASKKVGISVQRNRAKRRLRALVDKIFPQNAKGSRDYVLIARSGTLVRAFSQLENDLVHLLKRTQSWQT